MVQGRLKKYILTTSVFRRTINRGGGIVDPTDRAIHTIVHVSYENITRGVSHLYTADDYFDDGIISGHVRLVQRVELTPILQ